MIELRDVSVAYETSQVLERVSFRVQRGAFTGLAGANGSGKTTILRLMARLHTPHTGEVLVDDRDVASYSRRELARLVSGVWQRPSLSFGFTARQIVLLGRTPYLSPLRWETRDDEAIAGKAMEETQTAHLASRIASTLSAGELQRVFIAAALAQQTRVLLLDEPTSFLDLRQAARLSALLKRLSGNGITIVCASHDLALLRRHATSIVILADRQASTTTPDALTREMLTRVFDIHEEEWYA